MIDEAAKACIMHEACSLLIWIVGSETAEERVFGKSIVKLPTKCFDSDGSHAKLQFVFNSVPKHFGFYLHNSKFYKVAKSLLWMNSYFF